jgi:fructose-1,6-bisphosphatase/inositol monophosphatase family enzyme
MRRLVRIVRQTGEAVLQLGPHAVFDTVAVGHHYFSTVDSEASRLLRAAVAAIMKDMPITIVEEAEITQRTSSEPREFNYPLLVGDAVEGSTNGKRGLTAMIQRPIRAGTSTMILENEQLSSIVASAFFDFASKQVFSAVRGERGSFIPFINEKVMSATDVVTTCGDSQFYAAVPGYSHSNIEARAQVERVLHNAHIYTTGGSRSSAQDLLDIAGNQIDAYVDLRACFPGTTDRCDAVLHPWDVGGLLPFLDGLGLLVVDPFNRSWQEYSFSDRLALIVARPDIGSSILEAIHRLPFVTDQPMTQDVIPVSRASAS